MELDATLLTLRDRLATERLAIRSLHNPVRSRLGFQI
jgi:hypothetical protein